MILSSSIVVLQNERNRPLSGLVILSTLCWPSGNHVAHQLQGSRHSRSLLHKAHSKCFTSAFANQYLTSLLVLNRRGVQVHRSTLITSTSALRTVRLHASMYTNARMRTWHMNFHTLFKSVLHRNPNPAKIPSMFLKYPAYFPYEGSFCVRYCATPGFERRPASTCCSADILAVGCGRAHGYVCGRVCSCSRQQCTRLTLMLRTLLFLARASPPASLRCINNSTLLSPLVLSS